MDKSRGFNRLAARAFFCFDGRSGHTEMLDSPGSIYISVASATRSCVIATRCRALFRFRKPLRLRDSDFWRKLCCARLTKRGFSAFCGPELSTASALSPTDNTGNIWVRG
jgi:hypothetical protein